MHEKRLKLIVKIYNISFTVVTVLLGAMFIFQICSIYYGAGDGQIYSRDIVSEKLSALLPLITVWFFGVISEIILQNIAPKAKRKNTKAPNYMICEVNNSAFSGNMVLRQKILKIVTCVVCLALAFVPMAIYFNASAFPAVSINSEVISGIKSILPFVISVFAIIGVYVILRDINYKKMAESVKGLRNNAKISLKHSEKSNFTVILRVFFICSGLALVVIGIFNGSMEEVFEKATKICTECIGLG